MKHSKCKCSVKHRTLSKFQLLGEEFFGFIPTDMRILEMDEALLFKSM